MRLLDKCAALSKRHFLVLLIFLIKSATLTAEETQIKRAR